MVSQSRWSSVTCIRFCGQSDGLFQGYLKWVGILPSRGVSTHSADRLIDLCRSRYALCAKTSAREASSAIRASARRGRLSAIIIAASPGCRGSIASFEYFDRTRLAARSRAWPKNARRTFPGTCRNAHPSSTRCSLSHLWARQELLWQGGLQQRLTPPSR